VEQFHSKRNEQLLERFKHLEPVASSDDEDYTDEVCAFHLLHRKLRYLQMENKPVSN